MKICYVAADVSIPGVTGASTHTLELARHLIEQGDEVFVICRRQPKQSSHEVYEGISVYRLYRGIVFPTPRRRWKEVARPSLKQQAYHVYLHTLFFIYAGLQIARLVKARRADVIIERGTSSGEGGLVSTITRRPLVLEIISPHYASLSLKRARKILTFSKKALQGVPESRIELVTAAANISLFSPPFDPSQIRKKYDLDNFHVLGYVGSFASWHGVETLVYATKSVLQHISNVKLLLVGPCPREISSLVNELGLGSHVVLTGPVHYHSVPSYLAACDVLVAPYSSAEWGNLYSYVKIYEYMAMGKPVITTDVIPDAKVIRSEKAGMLVPPDNPEKLSKAIVNLLNDSDSASRLGKRAREVSLRYSWEAYAKRLSSLLKEVAWSKQGTS